jgi:hypothetical protein
MVLLVMFLDDTKNMMGLDYLHMDHLPWDLDHNIYNIDNKDLEVIYFLDIFHNIHLVELVVM